jgi:uncharacterized membrane protein YfcA
LDWVNTVAGFTVGALVGMTGVGGGSLMAPILILVLGVAPATAVGTDLWFASITKAVGSVVHHRYGGPDLQIVRRLCYGSLPAAVATVWFLHRTGVAQEKNGFLVQALGGALLLTAVAMLLKNRIHAVGREMRTGTAEQFLKWQPALTVLAGAILGVLVTLTSVGAGALGATMLLMLYPIRLTPIRLVGTDIVHAVPLTLVAGLGHMLIGTVNFQMLGGLLLGSIPGIIVGSLCAARVPDRFLRTLLAGVLVLVGVKMITA